MAVSSPAIPFEQLNIPATKFEVRIGAADGGFPNSENWDWNLYPVSMTRTASGRRDDVLTIGVKAPASVVDNGLSNFLGRQVEVWAKDDNYQPTIMVGWGFISGKPIVIDDRQEMYGFEARIGDEHFGVKMEKYPVWDIDGNEIEVMRPLVFNPQIDTLIEGNMSDQKDDRNGWHFVIDPESMRTEQAREVQEQSRLLWKLSDAVLALCWWLNPDPYVTNPSQKDVSAAFSARNDLLKNVEIPIGTSLPDALDILLTPLEYGWCLVHGVDKDNIRSSKITFFQRGSGPTKSLLMQRPVQFGDVPEIRDRRKTSVVSFDAMINNAALANRVIGYGKYQEREITVELKPGWDKAFDTKRLADLKEDSAFYREHPEVLRKWIWDTAGDYIDFRDDMTAPVDLGNIFGVDGDGDPIKQLVVRRRFFRCLSQHEDADDKESNGYWLQWWNKSIKNASDADTKEDPGWVRIKWPFSVLEKECGIWFNGETPPTQLWKLFYGNHYEDARLRITATIRGDFCVKGDAIRRVGSPNKLDVVLPLDLGDKFQDSKVVSGGNLGSIFAADPTDARDDTAAIQQYCEQVRNVEDCLRMDSAIPLEGPLHPEYQIGDMLQRIDGRNLSLDLGSGRFPQVVGVVIHFQEQKCELLIESFRKERPRVVLEDQRRLVVGPQQPVNSKHFRMQGRDL